MAITIMIDRQSGTIVGDDNVRNRSYTIDELKTLASNGDKEAQCAMGDYFAMPEVFNLDKAMEWYSKAAGRGHAKAQFFMGQASFTGIGMPQDFKKAESWLKKAAEQGYTEAEKALAMYSLVF